MQVSTEGRRSTAVAKDFSPLAMATATEGLYGQRLKFFETKKFEPGTSPLKVLERPL